MEEGVHVQDLALSHVVVVEQLKGEDDEAGHDHIVDGPEIPDLEHNRQQ